MEFIFESRFTWLKLLGLILFLGLLYLALGLSIRILRNSHFAGRLGPIAIKTLKKIRNIFEPFAVLIGCIAFVFIHPLVNGLLFLVLLIGLLPFFRQYLAGKVILQTTNFKEGKSIRTQNIEGIIERIHKTGISLKQPDGIQFINFSTIQSHGYTLINNIQSGGLFRFKIALIDQSLAVKNKNWLNDLLVSSPYIDWSNKPNIQTASDSPDEMEVELLLKQNGQAQDFMQMIQDLGYNCSIVQ